ncbi:sigma-70 family RNA polymerase sigma factor [Streptomonospora alba]|uniref:sigma-70 family RNA polymerase sigma factor n=1 Tax=Streptomonospora alba TaxID=183763 RepID=UPI000699994A|nr:sigma-70 family RNA polymerase sigma factor [Streptomonospora alba]
MTEPQSENAELLIGDSELLARVRDGDTGAYEELYTRHTGAARGLARQLVRSESEVDDAVAETFARVLAVLGRGGGPTDGFRPYLLTALRHVVYDRFRGEKRQVATDDMEVFDSGEPFVDPAVAGLERSLIARAYLSLPERWQAVLWYTEIEGYKPADAAPNLGMNPNSVAALAYRAREGLRQAYLQMHLAGGAAEACRPTVGKLGSYVRGGLAKRETSSVDRHLDDCGNCREVCAELADVNAGLRGIVLPLVAGPAAAGYLAAGGGVPAGVFGWWQQMPENVQQAAGGTAVAATVAAVAFALVSNEEPVESTPSTDPPAAAEAPAQPEPPAPEPPAPEPPQPDAPPADDPPSASDDKEPPAREAASSAPPPEEEPAPEPPPQPDAPPEAPAPQPEEPPDAPASPAPPEPPAFNPPGAAQPPADPPPFQQDGFDPPGVADPPANPPPARPGNGGGSGPGAQPPGLAEQGAPAPPGQADRGAFAPPRARSPQAFAPVSAAGPARMQSARSVPLAWTDACPRGDGEWRAAYKAAQTWLGCGAA